MTEVPQGQEINELPIDLGNARSGDRIAAFRPNDPEHPEAGGQAGQATLAEADPATIQGEIDKLQEEYDQLNRRLQVLENAGGGGDQGGGDDHPQQATTYWIGLSPDAAITPDELTASSTARGTHVLVVPTIPAGQRRHVVIARPASLGAFSFVYYYPPGHRDTTNGIGGWQAVANLTKDGIEQVVLISRALLADTASGRQVEAG